MKCQDYKIHTTSTWNIFGLDHWCELSPWSRICLERLVVTLLFQKFPAFYGIEKFIDIFTEALH
jgi:hypothetical protein